MTERKSLFNRVEDALSTIRPHLQVDGGDVELVEITDDMHVKIKWVGMCESCNMSAFTLKAGIQEAIRANAPEVVSVDAVNGI
jgi:Fe-S cluster biogenesis protein NfuA